MPQSLTDLLGPRLRIGSIILAIADRLHYAIQISLMVIFPAASCLQHPTHFVAFPTTRKIHKGGL
jgi:hypothetical protein